MDPDAKASAGFLRCAVCDDFALRKTATEYWLHKCRSSNLRQPCALLEVRASGGKVGRSREIWEEAEG